MEKTRTSGAGEPRRDSHYNKVKVAAKWLLGKYEKEMKKEEDCEFGELYEH